MCLGVIYAILSRFSQYAACYPDWQEYFPRTVNWQAATVRHFSTNLKIVAPAPASPAILSYLTLVNKLSVSWETTNYMKPIFPALDVDPSSRSSSEYDGDWARIHSLPNPKSAVNDRPSGAFTPGSLEGVWEGIFTVRGHHHGLSLCMYSRRFQYTEFTSYAALLSGAPPSVLQRSLVAQHRQTIKLHEWHLLEDEDPAIRQTVRPLVPGNPCRAYVPDDLTTQEVGDTLELIAPGQDKPLVYQSWTSIKRDGIKGRVRDVFLTGQVSGFPMMDRSIA